MFDDTYYLGNSFNLLLRMLIVAGVVVCNLIRLSPSPPSFVLFTKPVYIKKKKKIDGLLLFPAFHFPFGPFNGSLCLCLIYL